MMSSTVMRGFSDEKGSWKIICSSRRSGRSWRLLSLAMSTVVPAAVRKLISPEVGSIARRMHRDVVVLPQPLSPTSARVSPSRMWNETSSTART
jgi:hypothetical protein